VSDDRVVIIGSGLAGLTAGCLLAQRGVEPLVLEKRSDTGGCCSAFQEGGYRFDLGATMLQTPEVVWDVFEELGRDPADYLDITALDPLYSLRFADGATLELVPDVERTAANIAAIEPGDVDGFRRYIADMDQLKRTLKSFFVERGRHGLSDYLSRDMLRLFGRLSPWTTVERMVASYFKSERMRTAFGFQTLYFGAAPHRCPAIYGMVPYFEITQGVWYTRGGLNAIADALAAILRELGGTIELDAAVEEIEVSGGRARGVRLADGRRIEASRVLSNADAIYTYLQLLPRAAVPARARHRLGRADLSCSALVALIGIDDSVSDLQHHNFLLPHDFGQVCRHVFDLKRMPPELWAYLCYPTRSDPTVAPTGRGSLYVLVLVPNRQGERPWEGRPQDAIEYAYDQLERRGIGGLRGDAEVAEPLLPAYYANEFNTPAGMVLGMQPTLRQIGPLRPRVRSPHVEGLYLAGASANPGAGIPLVVSSGRKAALAMLEDGARPSRRFSRERTEVAAR
jgi:phytoene desaturase